RNRGAEHVDPLARTHRAKEPETQRSRSVARLPGPPVIERRPACAAIDLVEVRLAEAHNSRAGLIQAHLDVDASHEITWGDNDRGAVQGLNSRHAPPSVVVEDLQVVIGPEESLVVVDERLPHRLASLVAGFGHEVVADQPVPVADLKSER